MAGFHILTEEKLLFIAFEFYLYFKNIFINYLQLFENKYFFCENIENKNKLKFPI